MDSTKAGISNAQSVNVINSTIQTTSGNQYNYTVNHNSDMNDERQTVANWLSSLNFKVTQNEFIQKREHGTGEWLLESQEFKDWRDGSSEVLWCPGDAGVGKTILASIIVNHLQTIFEGNDMVAIVFIYCNYKERAEQTLSNLVSSLLKQMAQHRRAMSDNIKSFYQCHRRESTRPTLHQITCALKSEIEAYSKVFVVVDALDECREDNGSQRKLLKLLRSLDGNVNLLVTSRNLPSITQDFEATKRLYIRAKDDDIRKYVEGRVALGPRHLRRLQETVVMRMIESSRGMFLLARLHMDSLMEKLSTAEVRTALGNLPKGLDDTYDEAMERVERQDDNRKQLAKRVLSWISYVVRPMTVNELQHALAVVPNTTNIDLEAIIDEEILISVCAGLIVTDGKQGVIRLVHYTAQKYFERHRESHFPDAQADIASTCITYLSFDVFGVGCGNTYRERKLLLRGNPFLDYAARHWGDHACGQEETIKSLALKFLQDDSKVACASQIQMRRPPREQLGYSGMHMCSYFGLEKMMQYLLENGAIADVRSSSSGRSPLSIAAEHGHEGLVQLLLARDDLDVNSKDSDGRTPLLFAASNGHEAVVQLLLARDDVDINSKDSSGSTSLSRAASNGHEAAVKLLLARDGLDVNSKDSHGRTPLFSTATNGHAAVLKLLLARGDLDVNSRDSDGRMPSSLAAEHGNEAVLKLLLGRDNLDVHSQDSDGRTPLSLAAENGHEAVLKVLLARDDLDVNSKDSDGWTPLSLAAANGHLAVVKLLLECDGVDVNSEDSYGLTPLSLAAAKGHLAVVKLLLARDDLDVNSKDSCGLTPLSFASDNGHEEVVKLLLAQDAVFACSRQ